MTSSQPSVQVPLPLRLQPLVEALALGTLGATLLHTVASGQVKTLLHPMLQPLVAGGGIVLLLAALLHASLASPLGWSGANPGQIGRMAWKIVRDLLVALAVAGAVAVAPGSFSSLALSNRVADPSAVLKKVENDQAPPLQTDATGALKVETVDLLMAAEHPDTIQQMDGHRVRFIGQYLPGDAGNLKIVRFLMFCCAADAQPVSVGIKTPATLAIPSIDKMGWAEVAGTVHFPEDVPGKRLPVVTAEEIKPIPEPSDKYIY